MLVYEEYATAADKKKAQRGAKRGRPTGKATGYFFAFNENGRNNLGGFDGVGSVIDTKGEPVGDSVALASVGPSLGYLLLKCRRIGAAHLSPVWKREYNRLKKN